MAQERVFFPVKDVTLCGVLSDVNVVLRGISDAFAYRENTSAQGVLILAVQTVISAAIKEIKLSGGIWLDAGEISLFSKKDMSLTDGELILSALISTAIQKAVAIISEIRLSGEMTSETDHDMIPAPGALSLSAAFKEAEAMKTADINSPVTLFGLMRSTNLGKPVSTLELVLFLQGVFQHCADQKEIIPVASAVSIAGSMSAVARRFRTLGDLTGLTLGDVQGWRLYKFYFKEE